MKKSSKAALLSALIFPGAGHLFLKSYLRGFGLLLASLAALSVVVVRAYQKAQLIVDQIVSGSVPMDSGAITQAVANSTTSADNLTDNTLVIVLAVCWLAGILDSYRLGARQDQ